MCRVSGSTLPCPRAFSSRQGARPAVVRCAASKEAELKQMQDFKENLSKNLENATKGMLKNDAPTLHVTSKSQQPYLRCFLFLVLPG